MIKANIQEEIYNSLKSGKQTALKVLRYIMSEIKYLEIERKKEVTDEEIVNLLQKEAKKRKEAIEMFRSGKRMDLVSDEEKQLEILGKYLPKQISTVKEKLKIIS
ncbi:hypothetical protein A2960_00130 [Candidatus Gottesmanbacteria bacterium RIFCSPLOWO2_01_FULL_39_12b]|uniref:GatB/YqeY domain-containing protein n=1 Tax=Candidatus Gottesmanbacteria bacterium RIFCSPLOWO2_01_FULL_39_12b TaxID=1798388 RepID=A0A1F6ARP4_9BACT|nr:MAG: hypothetical protein A2960_00130 [Candidatus Gottesmanbacteria bacterium RIFCSPLOWO2_01_FULL_39_12b]